MTKQTIRDAVTAGLRQVKGETDAAAARRKKQEQKKQRALEAAFNAASGVIEGLTILQEMEGSKFTFQVNRQIGRVSISTNIPTSKNLPNTLEVISYTDGHICAYGDLKSSREDILDIKRTKAGATEKVVTFVARHAAKAGLVPTL